MSDENINEPQQYFCTECGLSVGKDDMFCPNCGTDLSVVEEYNPDEPVVLKIFLSADAAKTAIANLAANEINATEGLKSWSQAAGETIVYVRKEDLPRAQVVLKLMANKPQPMQLGDIFSSSFTVAGKTLKRNLIIAAMFIPAAILTAYSMSSFFGAISDSKKKNNKTMVNIEVPAVRIIHYEFSSIGTIDSNLNAVIELDEEQSKAVKASDTLWVNLDSTGHRELKGVVSEVISLRDGNDTLDTYQVIIKFFENDNYLQPNGWCETEFYYNTPNPVLSLSHDCLNYSYDEDEEDSTAVDTSASGVKTDTPEEYVYTVIEGKAKLLAVTTGVYDDDYIEIKSGLSGSEQVISYVTDYEIEDGEKVVVSKEPLQFKSEDFKLADYGWQFFFLILVGLLCGLVYLAVNIGVTKASLKELAGETISVKELFRTIFSSVFIRCIALFLFIILVTGGVFFLIMMLIALGSDLKEDSLGLIAVLLFFPVLILGSYLYIRWYFSSICIIDTGAGIAEALKRSSLLVKGYWWRTFGIVVLVSITVSFMISMITTPVSFIFMWDYISYSFSSSSDMAKDISPEQMKSFAWGLSLSILLSYLLEALILPVFHAVMYTDLKFKKNDYLVKLKPEKVNPEFPLGQS